MLLPANALSELITPEKSARVALATGIVLALVAVWLVVRMAWMLLGGVSVASAPVPEVPQAAPASGERAEFRWDLFGRSAPAAPMVRQAPATQLDLHLRGVVSGGDSARAIIAGGDSTDSVYGVGDELPGGAEIEAIEARRVLIRRDGRTEELALDPDERRGGDGNDVRRSTASAAGDDPRRGRSLDTERGVSAASLSAIGTGGLDLERMAGAITVRPVSGGGFRVRPGRDATLFSELGLEVNDVVKAVNGQPLESEDDVRSLFTDVLRSGEIAITVNRRGREMTLRPDLETIAERLSDR